MDPCWTSVKGRIRPVTPDSVPGTVEFAMSQYEDVINRVWPLRLLCHYLSVFPNIDWRAIHARCLARRACRGSQSGANIFGKFADFLF